MEMVAAAKLRRFQDFLESTRSYTEGLARLVRELVREAPADYRHPFLVNREPEEKKTALVLFTSDTGLCGTYNSEIEGAAHERLKEYPDRKTLFVFVGKHGARTFERRGLEAIETFSDLRVSRVDEILEGLEKTLRLAFEEGRVDEIDAVYTRMESLARFEPTVERLLPIAADKPETDEGTETLIEPDRKTVLDRLLPASFRAGLRFIFYHALLTEQIARMNAMRQATKNAKDMIDELTLLRNKARQASITKEIIEIVSGSRALKLK